MTRGIDETIEQQIHYLHLMIDECREECFHNIADMFAKDLQILLANYQLNGNKPQ